MTSLVRTATSQYGLLSTRQLREGGITRSRQATLVRQGMVRPIRQGVVGLIGAPSVWQQQLLAVILTPGSPVVASHRSALRVWGLRSRFDRLEVSVRYPGNRQLPGVSVHRSVDLTDDDITVHEGIRVTTVARSLCDAGLIFPDHEVQRLVDHAVATGLVTAAELLAVRRRVGEHGRNGVIRLELAVDGLPAGAADTDSGPEVRLLRLLARAGLPEPTRQHSVQVGGRHYLIDVAFPDVRLALEYDGVDPHTRFERFIDDRRRQNDLVGCRWTVLRYTHVDLRDRPWVLIGQVRRHLSDLRPVRPAG